VDEKTLTSQSKQLGFLFLAALLLAASFQPAMAQEAQAPADDGASTPQQFGGPNSVPGQLADDERLTESLTDRAILEDYFDWKKGVREKHGLDFSLDYTAGVLTATNTLGTDDLFAGGAVRFFGRWDLIGRDSGNTGTFVWKIEHRHKYTDIPPQGTASQIGYVGLMLPVLSDIGTRLTNLYWKQNLSQGRVEIIAGMIDTTDWVDVYALASPWNGFFNFVFATGGAAIPVPDDSALGVYVNGMITDNLYISGGFADSNADSTDPFDGFDTFFNDREYFKTVELGWVTSQDRFYLDNTHLTYWHADKREKAGVPSGWGLNFSFSRSFDEKWMPFFRAGYAEDGGTLLQKTISAGLGYHLKDDVSLFGLGINWGQPNETTFGPGLSDQYAIELFSRLQVMRNFQLTPDIQYINNPALNPTANHSWVFGLRARLVF
jgi:porin